MESAGGELQKASAGAALALSVEFHEHAVILSEAQSKNQMMSANRGAQDEAVMLSSCCHVMSGHSSGSWRSKEIIFCKLTSDVEEMRLTVP